MMPVALMLTISGAVGFLFLPNTAGKSLEEIAAERGGYGARERATTWRMGSPGGCVDDERKRG
jgi:hypothetical protein